MGLHTGRIDLHVHSLFSDGYLLPSEILRRAVTLGYSAIAITDHVDASNLDEAIAGLLRFQEEQKGDFPLRFVPGVELTHIAPQSIAKLARRAKLLGAKLVVVHGESLVEPVVSGTNLAAVSCPDVDILAHPGLITSEEAQLAKDKEVYLEITSRQGHCLANGHVAMMAQEVGAKLIVNTDAHSPGDMMNQEMAQRVAAGAGLDEEGVRAATITNPEELLERALSLERRPA